MIATFVVPAGVAASRDSVDECVGVETGFHGQCGLGEAVQVRQRDTTALAELPDVADCYVVSQASARLVGEHCRVGAAVPGHVTDALLDEPGKDSVVEE
jgi:hypothetical protein